MFDDDDSDNNVASKDDDLFKPISKLNSKPAKEKKPAAKKPAAEKKPKAPPKKKAEKKGIVLDFFCLSLFHASLPLLALIKIVCISARSMKA